MDDKYKLLVFDEIDSTNSEAIRIAKTCPNENYILVAKNQTNSRGRNAKTWHSSLGNLHTSILLKHQIDLAYIPQLSFVTGLAVYKTINSLEKKSEKSIKLKWPNDILINDKKVSGILLETISINNNHYLIIGIGINIRYSPINIDQLTTNLVEENIESPDPQELLNDLIINFEKYFSRWKREGFGIISQYWLRRACNLGKIITINDGNSKITGIFDGIDENGSIKIRLESGKTTSRSSVELLHL